MKRIVAAALLLSQNIVMCFVYVESSSFCPVQFTVWCIIFYSSILHSMMYISSEHECDPVALLHKATHAEPSVRSSLTLLSMTHMSVLLLLHTETQMAGGGVVP